MKLTNTTRYNKSEGAECDFFFMAKHTELDTAGENLLVIEILLYKKSVIICLHGLLVIGICSNIISRDNNVIYKYNTGW